MPDGTAPAGARQPNFSTEVVERLIVMVCEAVCGVGKPLSVTVTARVYEEGGDGGTIPLRMTVVPVFAESVSHDAPEEVHLNPPVPPDAEQETEYGAPCSDEPPVAEQLIFNFGALTEIAMACDAV